MSSLNLEQLNQELLESILNSILRLHTNMNHAHYIELYNYLNNLIEMPHPHIIVNLSSFVLIAIGKCQRCKEMREKMKLKGG